jgi:hypothetical protein
MSEKDWRVNRLTLIDIEILNVIGKAVGGRPSGSSSTGHVRSRSLVGSGSPPVGRGLVGVVGNVGVPLRRR